MQVKSHYVPNFWLPKEDDQIVATKLLDTEYTTVVYFECIITGLYRESSKIIMNLKNDKYCMCSSGYTDTSMYERYVIYRYFVSFNGFYWRL